MIAVEEETRPHRAVFDEKAVLKELKHYLPEQASLKDFIHQNTLHAFQHMKFYDGLRHASVILGYKVTFKLREFRQLYKEGKISDAILERVILDRKGGDVATWKGHALNTRYGPFESPRIGTLRAYWKKYYRMDMDSLVHPILFRILCSYLDQGISMWRFPAGSNGFIEALREMERNSFTSFFRRPRARKLLLESPCELQTLLAMVVSEPALYEHYLFDQQFAHQGWSGIVNIIEDQPQTLIDQKKISLRDLIIFELLLEIDALDFTFGETWEPLGGHLTNRPASLLSEVPNTEFNDVIAIWQDAFEWTYYDQVVTGIGLQRPENTTRVAKTFQAIFCIDDRECSFRRYLEAEDPNCETFGTPGFFGAEFYYQPENGKFYTKVCPAPITPKYLIKEKGSSEKIETELHLTKHSHGFFSGWLISQTLGFWSAFKLFINIFRPALGPTTASSFRHMDRFSDLTIDHTLDSEFENGLQIGFSVDEMVTRTEGLLKSIGLVKDFAPLVYIVGHGSSSVNNPHYAAYDCGACSGRPGSVNARVICHMLNKPEVRAALATRGIQIPDTTRFEGALHDTTRDEIAFYDERSLDKDHADLHQRNKIVFAKALQLNSKERARRFELTNSRQLLPRIHEDVKTRSVSLFEPRPELNHATNALCIVGRRALTEKLFLDRRAFLNSYDYRLDPDGKYLLTILRPAAPVCGGINLEYFFSRVDNQKLGAGTKLPHNVMGLFGVANGIDGDLRPGLPSQMIEVHDPVRLLIIVEHKPAVVLETIQKQKETYEWFINEWVNLVVVDPETHLLYRFKEGGFVEYKPLAKNIQRITPQVLDDLIEKNMENLPVFQLS